MKSVNLGRQKQIVLQRRKSKIIRKRETGWPKEATSPPPNYFYNDNSKFWTDRPTDEDSKLGNLYTFPRFMTPTSIFMHLQTFMKIVPNDEPRTDGQRKTLLSRLSYVKIRSYVEIRVRIWKRLQTKSKEKPGIRYRSRNDIALAISLAFNLVSYLRFANIDAFVRESDFPNFEAFIILDLRASGGNVALFASPDDRRSWVTVDLAWEFDILLWINVGINELIHESRKLLTYDHWSTERHGSRVWVSQRTSYNRRIHKWTDEWINRRIHQEN